FQAEDGIRDRNVTGVQTCALPISATATAVDVTLGIVLVLFAVGLVAGWIDAVVGGGGLVQLPALLLVPGISAVQALATNKVGSRSEERRVGEERESACERRKKKKK